MHETRSGSLQQRLQYLRTGCCIRVRTCPATPHTRTIARALEKQQDTQQTPPALLVYNGGAMPFHKKGIKRGAAKRVGLKKKAQLRKKIVKHTLKRNKQSVQQKQAQNAEANRKQATAFQQFVA